LGAPIAPSGGASRQFLFGTQRFIFVLNLIALVAFVVYFKSELIFTTKREARSAGEKNRFSQYSLTVPAQVHHLSETSEFGCTPLSP